MSSENEWSDDENEENSVEEKDILDSGNSESEEEFLDYLKQTLAVMNKDDFIYNSNSDIQVKKKNKRKRKKKEKQFILLNFSCDEIKNEKKKWRSKRMEAKKKKEGKTSSPKRRFKPRLPKPKKIKDLSRKKEDTKFKFNTNDFPTLGKVVKPKKSNWGKSSKDTDLEI